MATLKAPPKKGRVTMHIDNDVITFFKMLAEKECCGYQTLMNAALRAAMNNYKPEQGPVQTE